MSERLLKIIVYLAGLFCLFVFVAVRSLPVMNTVLVEKMIPEHFEFTKYGELYYQSYISHFKEVLPDPIRKYRLSDKHPAPEEADIYVFGDSFLDISRQATLPERLQDTLGKKVFFHRFMFPQYANPFCVFQDLGIGTGEPKTVIYETAERNIPMKFDTPYLPASCKEQGNSPQYTPLESLALKVFPQNSELMYRQFLKRSYLTTAMFEASATKKFDLFGYISDQTPVYKTGEQPWLFFNRQLGDEPGSFYYDYTREEIDRYCDHIALLAQEMKSEMNMSMIFMPIPNKYSIYHHVVNDDVYNDFLPRLYAGLRERGVEVVELYNDFMKSDQLLYYGTDTHWNKRGVDIALQKLLDEHLWAGK